MNSAETLGPLAVAAAPALDRHLGRRRWIFAVAALPLFTGAMAFQVSRTPSVEPPRSIDLTELAAVAESPAPVEAQSALNSLEVTVQRNDTLDSIFRTAGLDLTTLAELRARPEARKGLDRLNPGDTITLTRAADGSLQSLSRRVSATQTLSISRTGSDFAVSYLENPLEHEVIGHRARITTSLFDAGQAAGISAPVILSMANDMFGWDIDFALEIREGDEFGVLYEQNFQDGQYVGDGRVLAAEFVNAGKVHRAVWFESADGKVRGYFSPDGHGMRKAFLRAPVDFTRISSRFNLRRLHPISGIVRAHKGIDYAAPTGTPIRAAGSGRVEFAGRKGGYGNAVILNHGNGVTTLYGHMSRIARTSRTGTRIQQGEVIGYVGSTGASTGPHLHYEYRVNGVHKNPAKVTMPRTELPANYKAEFAAQSTTMLAKLDVVARPLPDGPVYASN